MANCCKSASFGALRLGTAAKLAWPAIPLLRVLRYGESRLNPRVPENGRTKSEEIAPMTSRIAILAGLALALTACTTATVASNPLQARWNGKAAGSFFAAYGPPQSDMAGSGGSTLYKWRGGYAKGKSCTVELTVNDAYRINNIRAVADRVDPKGGPTHCEKVLDAAGEEK